MRSSFNKYIFLSALTGLTGHALAQKDTTQLHKEVEVVKAYQPSISDAFKINDIPQIKPGDTEKPVFDYRINPQPVFTTFTVEPVQAAQMTREPKEKLTTGMLKAGVGNYQTPYGELFLNGHPSKNTTLGLHLRHLSSNGKIKLLNDDKVKAPHSDNLAEFFTKHAIGKSSLSTKLFFEQKAFRYYGYAGDSLSNTAKEAIFPLWDAKQSFSRGGLSLGLAGNEDPKADFRFTTGFKYQYFGTKTGQKEHLVKLNGLFDKKLEQFNGQLGIGLTFVNADSILNQTYNGFGNRQEMILTLKPSVFLEGDIASLRVGINSYSVTDSDTDGDYLLTPNVKGEWFPIQDVLTLYAGLDGYLEHNHYSAVAAENQFVNPYHDIKNAKHRYILTGGVRSKLSPRFHLGSRIDYANIKDQHFYILNDNRILSTGETTRSNTFDALYDKVKQLTIGAELFYAATDQVSLLLKGKFHSYNMNTLEEAWHKPAYEATTSLNFRPDGPLSITADINLISKRKGLIQTSVYDTEDATVPTGIEQTVFTLEPVLDLNFGLNYRYSKNLNFWGQVNNFSFQKYESWLGYTNKGLNLIAGISFSF